MDTSNEFQYKSFEPMSEKNKTSKDNKALVCDEW